MKIVDIALSQEGIEESGVNDVLYNTWYYGHKVSGGSYPWCAVFISWCAEQAGLSTDILPKTASVSTLMKFFENNGRYHSYTEYFPKVGDIMIQKSNGYSHVGIVVSIDQEGFNTIEGDVNNKVSQCRYRYETTVVTGFGSPNYPVEIKQTKRFMKSVRLTASSGNEVVMSDNMSTEQIWDWFRYKGYSPEATAGIMGRMQQEHNFSPDYAPIHQIEIGEVGGMGMFQWTWDRGHLDEPSVSDLTEGRSMYPDSRLAKYLDWCDANGRGYESCASQLDYLWEHDLDDQSWTGWTFKPEEMNGLSIEEAAHIWTTKFERGQSGSEVEYAYDYYEQFKDRPAPDGSRTVPSTVSNKVTTSGKVVKTPSDVGRYTYIAYTVKEGDTLESIAEAHNVAPQMIVFANDLTEWKVTPGQVIYIPQAKGIMAKGEQTSGVDALKQKTHTMSVTVSHPTVEIHFYGEYGKLAAISTLSPNKNTEVDNDIISVNTVRNQSQDCPTFTISLVWRNKWYDNLASNDMLVIYMQRPPEMKAIVMYGLIDDIRKTMDFSSGQPQRAVQVTGRGFNKCFVQFDVGLLENYSSLKDMGGGWFSGLTQLHSCSSYNAIKITVDSFVGKAMKYNFGDGKSLKDYFVYNGKERQHEILMDFTQFTSFNGSLWNFIKELANAPFNETYWEVINGKPTMVHRPTPFNKEDWIKLNRITVKDDNIVSNSTGRSDLETYTVYQCHMTLLGSDTINLLPPMWYPPYYPKYGLRQLKVETIYEYQNKKYDTREWSKELFNFNIKNNVFENGTIVVKGSNQYKVGERIILESENMEFYVESVSQSFNMYNAWTTSLGVTRGIQPEKRFTPPWGAHEELTPTVMMAIIQLTGKGKVSWYDLPERTFARKNVSQYGSNGRRIGSMYDFRGKTFTWPVPDYGEDCITSPFGPRTAPTAGASSYHNGIDIGGDYGATIIAACDGTVISSGPASGFGHWIRIDHGDGIVTIYGHMYADGLIAQEGSTVKAGEKIALMGSDGYSTGPHLHFQVEIDGEPVDPMEAFAVRKSGGFNDVGVSASQEEVALAVYQYATGTIGLNKAAACALLGNIEQESSFIIDNENSIGAFGLCQWWSSRRTGLERFCRENGLDVLSVAGQMGWLVWEFNNTEIAGYNVLINAPDSRETVYETSVSFGEAFERYGEGEEGSRGKNAVKWYDSI